MGVFFFLYAYCVLDFASDGLTDTLLKRYCVRRRYKWQHESERENDKEDERKRKKEN